MTTRWVSPGGKSFDIPDSVAPNNILRPHFIPKKALVAGKGQVFRPVLTAPLGYTIRATVKGANVVSGHAQAFAALLPGAIWTIQSNTGQFATEAARSLVPVDTGATKRSIHPEIESMIQAGRGRISVAIGPDTFYSPFIEFGLGGHAHIGPRPFMTDAFFRIAPHWYQAFLDLAKVARGGKFVISEPLYAPSLNAYLGRWRKHLYTVEKAAGDIVPLGSGLLSSRQRGGLLGTARILGDVQSVLGRVVGQRFQRRLTGKVTGRLIGIGSHTIFANTTMSAGITGGQRAYNRVAGRAMTKYVDQNQSLSRFTGG